MRLFVAAWPSPAVVEALAAVARPDRPGLRWTAPDAWHVTLRFLGEVADPQPVVDALRAAMEGVGARRATPADATSALGSVLVVRVDGLASLATLVRRATAGHGDPPRPEPFVGHITLARGGRRGLDEDLVGQALPTGGSAWSVGEVALVRSVLGGAGGRYETLASVALASAQPR